MDGTFVNVALTFRIDIRTIVPSTLSAEVKVYTTPCVVEEMRKLGQEYSGAVIAARRFEMRRCGHLSGSHSASQCLLDLIGTSNALHLMIATQDKTLRNQLRDIPGVPLLYFSASVLVLEPHSPKTLEAAKQIECSKTLAHEKELEAIKKKEIKLGILTPAEIEKLNSIAPPVGSMPKRKKVKGPNPLSCKKKKKVSDPISSNPIPKYKNNPEPKKRKERDNLPNSKPDTNNNDNNKMNVTEKPSNNSCIINDEGLPEMPVKKRRKRYRKSKANFKLDLNNYSASSGVQVKDD